MAWKKTRHAQTTLLRSTFDRHDRLRERRRKAMGVDKLPWSLYWALLATEGEQALKKKGGKR